MPPPAAAAPTDSNNAEQQRGADDGDRELDGAGAFNPRGAYDRIICDVPCSGDGTVRKDAFARRKWRPSFGATLHHVQRRIALRSAALLRVGGVLSYSTCSLIPIEDEAVVVAILRAARGARRARARRQRRARARAAAAARPRDVARLRLRHPRPSRAPPRAPPRVGRDRRAQQRRGRRRRRGDSGR
jgi:16S rRNA C967 or C1407 C5-methylase (RsmB/RsmF family)